MPIQLLPTAVNLLKKQLLKPEEKKLFLVQQELI